ncbi:MAG: hypothetical protein J7623_12840 [Chitinophaga sp.]|uniref:hypothetical protein n=1 Tax=Chitinophaga sp. TaxID=1869181 RepID=UPI001B0B4B01|nr:hypothetical protein [Chitinophaga sp.]MBO9729516.1 hypothetical protein [Chitinophaga sp.]
MKAPIFSRRSACIVFVAVGALLIAESYQVLPVNQGNHIILPGKGCGLSDKVEDMASTVSFAVVPEIVAGPPQSELIFTPSVTGLEISVVQESRTVEGNTFIAGSMVSDESKLYALE